MAILPFKHFIPVSYTHLVDSIDTPFTLEMASASELPRLLEISRLLSVSATVTLFVAVSYTHLDVYKRQDISL